MIVFESLAETLTAFISAGSVVSFFVCALLKRALNKAKNDAENRKKERNEQEFLRLEGEEKTAALILTLSRYVRGKSTEAELEQAENEYREYTDKANRLKRQMLSEILNR